MKLQIFFYRENFCIVKKTRRNKKQFDFLKPTNLRKARKRPNEFFLVNQLEKRQISKTWLKKGQPGNPGSSNHNFYFSKKC